MTILARPGVKSPRYMYLGGHVHGIYSFSKGLPGLHDYEFSFTFRCAEEEEILEKIVKFWHFWPWPLGLCKSDKSHEIYNYPKNASYRIVKTIGHIFFQKKLKMFNCYGNSRRTSTD